MVRQAHAARGLTAIRREIAPEKPSTVVPSLTKLNKRLAFVDAGAYICNPAQAIDRQLLYDPIRARQTNG